MFDRVDPEAAALDISGLALQLLGAFELATASIDDLLQQSIRRVGARTAKAVSKGLRREYDKRTSYLSAVLHDAESDAPVDALLQVYSAGKTLRDRVAHGSWTLAVSGDGEHEPMLLIAPRGVGEQEEPQEVPLSELRVQIHRLIWFEKWTEWVRFSSPNLADPSDGVEVIRRIIADTLRRPSLSPPTGPYLQ